jgi:citrate synthase
MIADAYSACVGHNPESVLGAPGLAGRYLIQLLAPAIGLLRASPCYTPSRKTESVAEIIAESAGIARSEEAIDALNSCLILSADHELAPSTFAVRIASSTGADIFSCISTGLGTFGGPLTGLGCDELERMLRAASSPKKYANLLKEQTRRKEPLLGYNHPLYPSGDPRALLLLDIARSVGGKDNPARLILDCVDAATEEVGAAPGLAIGLIAIAIAFGLPEKSPGALMAIGRSAGWIAHVFEQRLAGSLIRPKTRYIGPTS